MYNSIWRGVVHPCLVSVVQPAAQLSHGCCLSGALHHTSRFPPLRELYDHGFGVGSHARTCAVVASPIEGSLAVAPTSC